ncbi:hypothetical protein ACQPXB_40700 [Amycolatopsis sp. CA-161197]
MTTRITLPAPAHAHTGHAPHRRWGCRSCGARNRMRQRCCHTCRQIRPRR